MTATPETLEQTCFLAILVSSIVALAVLAKLAGNAELNEARAMAASKTKACVEVGDGGAP